jgi:tetratricopeptide (TPR) repeat protein
VLNNLGSLKLARKQLDQAEPFFRESLAIRRQAYANPHPAIATALRNLAGVLVELEQPDEAIQLANEAIDMSAKLKSPQHEIGHAQAQLGAAYLRQSQFHDAERELLAAIESLGPRISPNDDRGTGVLRNLVKLYNLTNRPERAAQLQQLLATSRPVTTLPTANIATQPSPR